MRQPFKFPKKGNKFNAEHITYDGIEFDSIIESRRYIYLKKEQEAGRISNLETHKTYELLPKQTKQEVVHMKTKDKTVDKLVFRAVEFTPDFVYEKDGQLIAEDVKGSELLVSRDFPLRRKMLYYKYGIYVYVVLEKGKKNAKYWVME